MTPPIDPADLAVLLKTLPKERPDPFPHLADLNATQLLTRRISITGQVKALDEERQVIDSEIQALFGDAALRSVLKYLNYTLHKQGIGFTHVKKLWDF